MRTLALGSGKQKPRQDVVRLDLSAVVEPDVVWDLRKRPYPFENGSFSQIECFDVIEHLDDIPAALEECHRLLKAGGVLKITTPHFSSSNSYIDPTHKHHLSYFSFDYFTDEHPYSYYSKARFHAKKRLITFEGFWPYRALMWRVANRFPHFYEKKLAWLFPAWFLYFELEAVKS